MIFDYFDVKSLALDIDLDANTVKLTDAKHEATITVELATEMACEIDKYLKGRMPRSTRSIVGTDDEGLIETASALWDNEAWLFVRLPLVAIADGAAIVIDLAGLRKSDVRHQFDYLYTRAYEIITIETDNGCIEVSGSAAGVFVSVSDDTDEAVAEADGLDHAAVRRLIDALEKMDEKSAR